MRNAIIIGLVVLILLLSGAWVYLLIYGSPENMGEVRNTLFGTSGDAPPPPNTGGEITIDDTPVDTAGPAIAVGASLAKLTDRKVAGAIIAEGVGESVVRYMEKGTGNIYEISLGSGIESRVSNFTLPGVIEAVWAESGMRVIIVTEIEGTRGDVFLGTLTKSDTGETDFTTEVIAGASGVRNMTWDDVGDTVLYAKGGPGGETVALAHSFKTNSTETLFTLPFGESYILWDTSGSGSHYAYTKPALGYMGYLYKISGNELQKVDEGLMLTAARFNDHIIAVNKFTGDQPYTSLIDTGGGVSRFISGHMPKEKCAGGDVTIWCGSDNTASAVAYPIPWYQGTVSFADKIWSVDPTTGSVAIALDPETVAREAIDVTDLMEGASGQVLFKNKKDDSLWLFNPSL